jgi:hypothetical protein
MGWKQSRLFALVGSVAVAVALLAVIPALGQTTPEEYVSFSAGAGQAQFAYNTTTQEVKTRNGCQLDTAIPQTLMAVAAGGGSNRLPGLFSDSLGVKSPGSNANGTPCSQVDGNETLILQPGTSLAGKSFSRVKLDLEMSGNAIVNLFFDDDPAPYELHTGTSYSALCSQNSELPGCNGSTPQSGPYLVNSGPGQKQAACAAPQNSGPNSGANDNCIWTVDPGVSFTRIELTVAGGGTVSLEGGSDTGQPSLFYLQANQPPVANDQTVDLDYAVDVSGDPVPFIFVLDSDDDHDFVLAASDPDGDELTITLASTTTSAGGTVAVIADGTAIRYTPPEGFTGQDSFTYTVADPEGLTDSAIVTIREQFTCDDTIEVDDGTVSGIYGRKGVCSDDKVYLLDIITTTNGASIRFVPQSADADPVEDCSVVPTPAACGDEYFAELTFAPREMANAPDTGKLQYDPVNRAAEDPIVFRDMRWCQVDPYEVEAETGEWPDPDDILPEPVNGIGESWCIVWVATGIGDTGMTVTTWSVYGIGDPIKGIT